MSPPVAVIVITAPHSLSPGLFITAVPFEINMPGVMPVDDIKVSGKVKRDFLSLRRYAVSFSAVKKTDGAMKYKVTSVGSAKVG